MYADALRTRLHITNRNENAMKGFTLIIPHPTRTFTLYFNNNMNNNNINQELFFPLKISRKSRKQESSYKGFIFQLYF